MELRKLQLTGGSSYTVTLPKEWIERSQLKAGDAVGFSPLGDGSLAVYPHARYSTAQSRYEVEVSSDDEAKNFRTIVAAYLNGFDIILVRSKKPFSPGVRRAVRQASRRIIGLQVVDEDAHTITLQDFMDPKEFHIDKGLRRMQAVARAMQEEALRAFGDDAGVDESGLAERDDEVDSLYWVINKQFHAILRDAGYAQKTGISASQALHYLMVARLIERTADHAARIAENVEALKRDDVQAKILNRLEKQARKAVVLFGDSLQVFHKRDVDAANKIIDDAQAFKSAQDQMTKEILSLGGDAILHVVLLIESIGRTAAYAADVAETAINHKVVVG